MPPKVRWLLSVGTKYLGSRRSSPPTYASPSSGPIPSVVPTAHAITPCIPRLPPAAAARLVPPSDKSVGYSVSCRASTWTADKRTGGDATGKVLTHAAIPERECVSRSYPRPSTKRSTDDPRSWGVFLSLGRRPSHPSAARRQFHGGASECAAFPCHPCRLRAHARATKSSVIADSRGAGIPWACRRANWTARSTGVANASAAACLASLS